MSVLIIMTQETDSETDFLITYHQTDSSLSKVCFVIGILLLTASDCILFRICFMDAFAIFCTVLLSISMIMFSLSFVLKRGHGLKISTLALGYTFAFASQVSIIRYSVQNSAFIPGALVIISGIMVGVAGFFLSAFWCLSIKYQD